MADVDSQEDENVLLDTSDFMGKMDMNEIYLEGEIAVPGKAAPVHEDGNPNTLDEPVKDTIMRDLRAVGNKFMHVLYPKESRALLRDWDLWGPLVLCVFLALMLQGHDHEDAKVDGGPQFTEVFIIYWVGSFVVTLNAKLLGGTLSIFQSVCVLGYCVLPLAISSVICSLILLAQPQTTLLFSIRFIAVLLGFAWSTFASTAFLADSQPVNRKALAVYPVFLFYFVISWLIISHNS